MRLVVVSTAIILSFVSLVPVHGKNEGPTPNSYGNYTIAEQKAIEEFRKLVGPELTQGYMRTDQYLIRWLRNQNLNLENAKRKLLNSLKWRKENRIDDILKEDFRDILPLCPYDTTGHDKAGRPVITGVAGKCKVRKAVLSGQLDRLRRAIYFVIEKVLAQVHGDQAKGKETNDLVMIANGFGFSLREHACLACLPLATEILALYEDHYPDYFYKFFFVNTPRLMETVIATMMPFLSERTKAVLNVYGYNKEEWVPELLKLIPADQLDRQFGGTRRPPNKRSTNVVKRPDKRDSPQA